MMEEILALMKSMHSLLEDQSVRYDTLLSELTKIHQQMIMLEAVIADKSIAHRTAAPKKGR
jgi:hypothetical protein